MYLSLARQAAGLAEVWLVSIMRLEIIIIYHKCEGRIEKSVPRITVCHHEACRVMTNGDREGRIFIFYLHTNNGFFSCSPLVFML